MYICTLYDVDGRKSQIEDEPFKIERYRLLCCVEVIIFRCCLIFILISQNRWPENCLKGDRKHAEVRPGVDEDSHGPEVISIAK